MKLQVGDLVRIKPTTELKGNENITCFVEETLGQRHAYGKQQEQVSLYAIDGEYVGDWFEDEFVVLGEKITENELLDLIEKYKDKKGLVEDFKKVLEDMKGNGTIK
jgi:hypothetical protein